MTQPPGAASGQNGQPGPNPYGQQPPNQQQPGSGQPPRTPASGSPQQPGSGQPPYGQPQQPYGQPPPYGQPQPRWPEYSQPQQTPGYGPPPSYTAQPPFGTQHGGPGPSPYGQPGPGWNPVAGGPPQPPRRKSRAGLVVGALAIVLVVVAAVVALSLDRKNTTATGGASSAAVQASPATTAATTTAATTAATTSGAVGSLTVTCSGGTIDSSAFSAKVPSGWSCTKVTTGLMLSDKQYDTLMVEVIPDAGDATTACESITAAGTLTALPDTQWGGKTATTASMANGSTKVHVRCAASNGAVYYLMAIPITGTYDQVVAGVDALTGAWTWK